MRDYLPPDEPATRKNPLYRNLFDGFDRIDGKPTETERRVCVFCVNLELVGISWVPCGEWLWLAAIETVNVFFFMSGCFEKNYCRFVFEIQPSEFLQKELERFFFHQYRQRFSFVMDVNPIFHLFVFLPFNFQAQAKAAAANSEKAKQAEVQWMLISLSW